MALPEITVGTLYSGSDGNCTLVRVGNTAVLIDAGRSAKRVCDALAACGLGIADIDAIFITHSHTDHVAALPVLTRRYGVPVHAAGTTADEIERLCAPGTLVPHPPLYTMQIGELAVHSFPTMHDTGCPVGYRVTAAERVGGADRGFGVGIATDLGCVTDDVFAGLSGCETVVIESNHDVGMLMCGPYTPDMKRRILSRRGHLSNTDCAALVSRLAGCGTREIILAHISKVNNRPELALEAVGDALRIAGTEAALYVAAHDHPVLAGNVSIGAW